MIVPDESGSLKLASVKDYESMVGAATVDRILSKARQLSDLHLVNVSSSYYGGGVAEILSSMTLLLNQAGIKTGWRIIQGRPDFFSVTKKYPQPLFLIRQYRKKTPWIWRCHVDLTRPNAQLWSYLAPLIERYDAVVLSLPAYAQKLAAPQRFIAPAINPFSTTNKELTDKEIDERLNRYNIPIDLPLVVQVSRFDKWKDPEGVIDAFQIARKKIDCTLVLVGNIATDDPEGQDVFAALCRRAEERIRILSVQDSALVNALQRKAAVVVQKSIREGFGLTVTEAMWKGAAVVGGRTGGIANQIEDGVNGFLVDSVEETADRIVALLKDRSLALRLGQKAKETVRKRFLMTRLMEDWLDLIGSFEASFKLKAAMGG